MSTEFHKSVKLCGLCQYWVGKRELSLNKNVRVELSNTNGTCTNRTIEKRANYTACPYFTKWEKLP